MKRLIGTSVALALLSVGFYGAACGPSMDDFKAQDINGPLPYYINIDNVIGFCQSQLDQYAIEWEACGSIIGT